MSTSDTPHIADNSKVICPKCVHQFRAIPIDVQEELNAARAELAKRKPVHFDAERVAQITAHRACGNQEQDMDNGKLAGYCVVCQVLWPCEYAGVPPTKPQSSSDEQARFEAWAKDRSWNIERYDNPSGFIEYINSKTNKLWQGWRVCVESHQPQGAPVAYRYKAVAIIDGVERVLIKEIDPNRQEYELVDSAHDYSHLSYPLNYPTTNDHEALYPASAWPQSSCPHLSTSKEGTSYCKLAEADAKDAERYKKCRDPRDWSWNMKIAKTPQQFDAACDSKEEITLESILANQAKIAAHREKP